MANKMSKGVKKKVDISDIEFDEELYPRVKHNWMTVVDYKESMLTGAQFPPIVLAVHKKKMYLVDGKHRVEAHKQLRLKKIQAIVFTGWSRNKIFREAVQRNITHGEKLTPFEKRRIALRLLEMKVKKQEVSELIQVSMDNLDNFVGARMVNAVTGNVVGDEDESDAYEVGQVILKSSLKHLAGNQVDAKQLSKLQKEHFSRDQVTLLKELVSLLESGTIDKTDKVVLKLLQKVKSLLRTWKFN